MYRSTPYRRTLLVLMTLSVLSFLSASAHAQQWSQGAVATDHPLASRVGAAMLDRGGNAVDAAIASALVLGVVNPFASGIGGGGFALVHDASVQQTTALDFRETAPSGMRADQFAPDGAHDPKLSVWGGLAIATPGEVAGLYELHRRYGSIAWHELVAPAIAIAHQGFPAHRLLIERAESLRRFSPERADDTLHRVFSFVAPLEEGTWIRRPKLAQALSAIALNGPDAFYLGDIATDMVDATQAAGGPLTLNDLRDYRPIWRTVLVSEFNGYTLHAFPPPSSGGLVVEMTLKAFERLQDEAGDHENLSPFHSAEALHRFLHAMTWAFAARAEQMGDPAFVHVDVEALLGEAFTERVVRSYNPAHRLPVEAFSTASPPANDDGTTHISVIDKDGNAVALTTTVNTPFASQVVSERFGILMNNEVDDFATAPNAPNAFGLVGTRANAVRPVARPLSSMTPTIVLRNNEVVGAIGASGGPRIITGTLLTLARLLSLDPSSEDVSTKDAIEAPRFHHQWQPALIDVDDALRTQFGDALRAKGYEVGPMRFRPAVQAVWRRHGVFDAGSDSAKYGEPAGTNHGTRENHLRLAQPPLAH